MKCLHFALCFLFVLNAWAEKPGVNTKKLNELKQNLKRVEKSIEVTKLRIKKSQEIQFLPELFLTLAELYSEKSRFMYSIKIESNPKTPSEEMDFTGEKRPKLEAIETYKNLIDRFPKFSGLDKVTFALAHEYRELGEPENALKVYKQFLDRFGDSSLADEVQLIVGNLYYDKKDYEFALEQYLKIIQKPGGSNMTPMAYYKAAACYTFLDKFLDSMISYDRVLSYDKFDVDKLPAELKKVDIREEALLASVWPMTELKPEELTKYPQFFIPMTYYKKAAYDKSSYRRVLARLGKRLSLKNRHKESAQAWFESFKLSDDPSQQRDAMESFYLASKAAKETEYPDEAPALIAQALRNMKMDGQDPNKYEAMMRDVATSTHTTALKTKKPSDLQKAINAYEDYLYVFENSKSRQDMEINKAEAYYLSAQYTEAGIAYYELSKKIKDAKKSKEFLSSSIQAFIESFKDIDRISALDKIQSRGGFRVAADEFVKKYPNDKDVPKILFNQGKSLYDEQNFGAALQTLRAFLKKFPRDQYSKQATLLILDCYYLRDDSKGLVKEANDLIANYTLSNDVKSEIRTVMGQAQLKSVRSIAGDFSSANYAKKFLEFANSSGDSGLGEAALLEAFASLRANNDFKAFEIGQTYIGKFQNSPKAKEILLAMSQMALITADYIRAAGYLALFSQKFSAEPKAKDYARQAAVLFEQMGEADQAAQAYRQLGQSDAAARVLFSSGRWKQLEEIAPSIPGTKGLFYQGIASYRQGKSSASLATLRKASESPARDSEEKDMVGHASFIVSSQELELFKKMGEGQPFTPALVQQKIQALAAFDAQMQKVIGLGVGRWTIASLSMLGQANKNFVDFLKNAPIPPGMTRQQLDQVLSEQIKNYTSAMNSYFKSCLDAAENFEVFSQFVESCRSAGNVAVDESQDTRVILKANTQIPAKLDNLRKKIYKDPRNQSLLQELASNYVDIKDFPPAFTITLRLSEIDPANVNYIAQLGMIQLYMNQLDLAAANFKEAMKKEPRQPLAVAGMHGLYKHFGFNKKKATLEPQLRKPASLQGIVHPWAR